MQTRQTNMIFIEKCSPFIGTFFGRCLLSNTNDWLAQIAMKHNMFRTKTNESKWIWICCYTLLKPANKTRLNTFDSLCFQRGLNPICSVFESSHIWFHWYSNKFGPKWAKKPVKQPLKTPKTQIYSLLLCALLGFWIRTDNNVNPKVQVNDSLEKGRTNVNKNTWANTDLV